MPPSKYSDKRDWFAARLTEDLTYNEIGVAYAAAFGGHPLNRSTVSGAIWRLQLSAPTPLGQAKSGPRPKWAPLRPKKALTDEQRERANARKRRYRARKRAERDAQPKKPSAEPTPDKRSRPKFWPLPALPERDVGEYRPVSLIDARHDQCRYPVQDRPFLFCGKKVIAGRSWCREHFAKVHIGGGRVVKEAAE